MDNLLKDCYVQKCIFYIFVSKSVVRLHNVKKSRCSGLKFHKLKDDLV